MEIFISLLIFAFSVYLFVITNNKIKTIKENVIADDLKKEIEALLTEFNGATKRNIELLEDKIAELNNLISKANGKIINLDNKIERANKPIVIEKVVEKKIEKKAPEIKKENAQPNNLFKYIADANEIEKDNNSGITDNYTPLPKEGYSDKDYRFEGLKKKTVNDNIIDENENVENEDIDNSDSDNANYKDETNSVTDNEESPGNNGLVENKQKTGSNRSEQLKEYIRNGKSKEELISMGYMENEINLIEFLIKRK